MYKKSVLIIVLLWAVCILTACSSPEATYKSAQDLLAKGKYSEAAMRFESLGSYEEAATLTIYCKACALCEEGNFESGIAALENIGDYKDSKMRITYYTARSWDDGSVDTPEFEWMQRAISIYSENPLYLDSVERIASLEKRIESAKSTLYNTAVTLMNEEKHKEAYEIFESLSGYKDSAEKAAFNICEAIRYG